MAASCLDVVRDHAPDHYTQLCASPFGPIPSRALEEEWAVHDTDGLPDLGEYRDREDFAADWLDQTGRLADVPEHPRHYIDFDAYGRDLVVGGAAMEHDGHWFYND